MALNTRQLRMYKWTVDIWTLSAPPAGGTFGIYARTQTGVKCMFGSTPENDVPSAVGRNKAVNIMTMDRFHFEITVPIEDTDFIHMTAGPTGVPDIGDWWAVQGGSQSYGYRANVVAVYAKKAESPAGA